MAQDDVNAGGADEYAREDDEEARINGMFDQVGVGGGGAQGGDWQGALQGANGGVGWVWGLRGECTLGLFMTATV